MGLVIIHSLDSAKMEPVLLSGGWGDPALPPAKELNVGKVLPCR